MNVCQKHIKDVVRLSTCALVHFCASHTINHNRNLYSACSHGVSRALRHREYINNYKSIRITSGQCNTGRPLEGFFFCKIRRGVSQVRSLTPNFTVVALKMWAFGIKLPLKRFLYNLAWGSESQAGTLLPNCHF